MPGSGFVANAGCRQGPGMLTKNKSGITRSAPLHFSAFCGYIKRVVTWDEPKRLLNLKDHKVDFVGCDVVFDGPVIAQEDDRVACGEIRINPLGLLHGRVVHMTYTERDDNVHVISLRKATKHEANHFFSQVDF
jgi:uncharacterized protein